jgi:site-specific DNA-methyltransferase (adenine-specific)
MIEAFKGFIVGQGDRGNQMMAYLVMMAVRLKELHRVLKPTGSLYLHCDPTASHYLKILLDTIFGADKFKSEISWKRSSAHNDAKQGRKQPGNIRDVIFFYTKGTTWTWNWQYTPYSRDYIDAFYKHTDENGRRFRLGDLTAAKPGGDTSYEFHGTTPYKGRFWAYSRENMEKFMAEGRLYFPKNGGTPSYKRYLDEMPGVPLQNDWDDIKPASGKNEYLGYPTQKPVALLERIISASSNEGDVVLDPFCGCGTTIAAAQKLNRQWIGIDITHLSVGLQKLRLLDNFGLHAGKDYKVVGQPEDLEGARQLAQEDRYGFQWWVLPLIGAKAFGSEAGSKVGKRGADSGIDGAMVFVDDNSGKAKRVIVSVKSGGVNVSQIRDLAHVVDREKAAIGVFLTLEPPTKPMIQEAVGAGFYHSPGWNRDYPKIQIITVEDILAGKTVSLPPNLQTFKRADRIANESPDQQGLGFESS